MSARRYRRLGIIMVIHAVVFSIVAFRGSTHAAFPVLFVVLAAVFFRRARRAAATETPR